MLKINLLPPYIFERRRIRQAMLLFGFLLVVVIGGMLGWWYKLGQYQTELTARVQEQEQIRDEVQRIEAQATSEEGKIPPIKQKVDFVKAVMEYNLKAPMLYEEIARWTYGRILYRSIKPSAADTLTIQARARSIGDCGRYLLNMYRATHLFSSVTISSIPGFPGGGGTTDSGQMLPGGGFDFDVTCKLVQPLNPPTYAGSGGGDSAGGGGNTFGGGGPSYSGGGGGGPSYSGSGGPGSGNGMPSTQEFQQAEQAPPPGAGGEEAQPE